MLHRTSRRAIAVFFLLTFLTNIFVPGISFALTAGPTAPEATSFEPVDTTDMVNLATGDLVYNLPLLEVPGPSGGYPLSLSYHAGIQPDVEASWVGLGFTLNPGAVSRFVNGYADDHKDAVITDHFYWNGQSRTTYKIGVTVPTASGASATAGLSFTQDSHHGFSVNQYASVEIPVMPGVSASASSNGVGQISAPGLQYLNMIQTQNATVGLGRFGSANISKQGISTSTGLGPFSLDMSINSKGVKPKLSVAGFAKGASREGRINTESSSITIPIPIGNTGAFLTLGRSYIRKWIDEYANVNVNGSLYFPQSTPDYTHMNARGFDTYDLLANTDNIFTNMDPEKNLDGSFADYDHYAVNAQGLTGSIKPYHFYEYMYRQNRNNDGTALTRSVPLGATGNKPGFRFVNDFSNRFLFEPPAPAYGEFDNSISMSFPTQNITAGMDGEGYENNILAGSKHIEYFTNGEIVNDLAGCIQRGFIDCNAVDFIRSTSDEHKMADQIGAFRITNESGVTYHFALPAYAFGEYTRTEQITPINGATYSEVDKGTYYAHTWFLTAVTGPDYVDRGGPGGAANGKIDKEDWGYWVEFGYSQWTYHYWWRNPVQGFTLDLDNNFQTFSRGRKQIYYLNFIRTATHIAVFDKSKRRDGRGMDGLHEEFEHSKSGSFARLDRVFLLQYKDLESLGGLPALNNMDLNRPALQASSIRSVRFNYDYSLCPNTINSFEDLNEGVKHGKLTLNSLEFLGKGGANTLPPVQFGYEEKNPVEVAVSLVRNGSALYFELQNSGLQMGDIIRFASNGNTYYAVIYKVEQSLSNLYRYRLSIIDGDATALTNGTVTVTETKNPPYNKDKYDMWRLYKSDFIGNVSGEARLTTALSAKSVDVWSLRRIKTMMGSEISIDYEADHYDEVVLNKDEQSRANQQALRIRDVTRIGSDKLQVYFYNDGYDLNEVFETGQEVDVSITGAYLSGSLTRVGIAPPGCSCPSVGYAHHELFEEQGGIVTSVSQQSYSITVTSTDLISKMAVSQVDVTDHVTMCGPDIISCVHNVAGSWPSFIAGGVVFTQDKPKWGGGIRVKKIAVAGLFKTFNTTYNYLQGVTSYEPVSILPFRLRTDYYTGIPTQLKAQEYTEASMLHKSASMKRYSNLLAIAREVPGPGVMYKQVEMRNSVTDAHGEYPNDNWQKYTFQTLTYDMVSYRYGQPQSPNITPPHPIASGLSYGSAKIKSVHINDLTTAVGNIKSIITYDRAGNPIESTEHSYLHDDYLNTLGDVGGYVSYANALGEKFQSQGVVVESFADARVIRLPQGGYALNAIMSKKRSYPSILTRTRHKNLKTGVETTNEMLAFDFFSGETIRALYRDQYGNAYVHETVPAYRQYQPMGLGLYARKNMLTQAAADYTYKVNPGNTAERVALVSANVQTWSDQVPVMLWQLPIVQTGIWRKQAAYSFAGVSATSLRADGLYPVTQVDFPWGSTPGPEWQKNIESTRYDVYSHDLEARDINNNYMATKMSYDQSKVFATASNAAYHEFAYSGAEDAAGWIFGGGVSTDDSEQVTSATAHTGQKSIASAPGIRGFIYTFAPGQKTYRVSVWATRPDAVIRYRLDPQPEASATVTNLGQVGSWYLLQADIAVTGSHTNMELWCEAPSAGMTYFDDFRMHPINAPMTSYVYNQWGELSHILNSNNLFTRFEYDEHGRLKETFRETLSHGVVKINDVQYQYSSGN